jgi:hypothetical protein
VPECADVRFFLGRGAEREAKRDEIFLDCDDSYEGLPNKVQEMVKWAYAQSYDYFLKCDDDVVLKPKDMLRLGGIESSDFVGAKDPACKVGEIRTPWGFCYWLSRKSMKIVMDTPLPQHNNDEAWVSTALFKKGIFLREDQRYYLHRGKRPENPHKMGRFNRAIPVELPPCEGAFAFCIYMNWEGWHSTPVPVQIKEFRKIFSDHNQ